jgi:hypothetical protein
LSNPFDDGAGDSINSILGSMNGPQADAVNWDGSSVFTFSGSGYTPIGYAAASQTNGSWSPSNTALPPGKGFWLEFAGNNSNSVITFTGSVVLSSTNTLLGNGVSEFTLVGSAYPASTNLVGLGINWLAVGQGVNQDGDGLFRWSSATQAFNPPAGFGFNAGSGWAPGSTNGPTLNVAEGFFYLNENNTDQWIQSFTVN